MLDFLNYPIVIENCMTLSCFIYMSKSIQKVSELGKKVRNAENSEIIINIISDFVIWSKTSFLIADILNIHNPTNGWHFHVTECYNGIWNALDLLGITDKELRSELSNISYDYLDQELTYRQIAEEIYIYWLVVIKKYSLQKTKGVQ